MLLPWKTRIYANQSLKRGLKQVKLLKSVSDLLHKSLGGVAPVLGSKPISLSFI